MAAGIQGAGLGLAAAKIFTKLGGEPVLAGLLGLRHGAGIFRRAFMALRNGFLKKNAQVVLDNLPAPRH
ncbi:hypothetical protein [Novosphingobium lindaniclasticum]|uniref:hypothetical protein n=1 Tax=Novosphingobium lindaniclasticum TaxID=1329895 RepID=UPI0013627B09|nr:hypothetical protein [Novosphingobium lindaniclasticum]